LIFKSGGLAAPNSTALRVSTLATFIGHEVFSKSWTTREKWAFDFIFHEKMTKISREGGYVRL